MGNTFHLKWIQNFFSLLSFNFPSREGKWNKKKSKTKINLWREIILGSLWQRSCCYIITTKKRLQPILIEWFVLKIILKAHLLWMHLLTEKHSFHRAFRCLTVSTVCFVVYWTERYRTARNAMHGATTNAPMMPNAIELKIVSILSGTHTMWPHHVIENGHVCICTNKIMPKSNGNDMSIFAF